MNCVDCYKHTRTECDGCHQPLCSECNDQHNEQDPDQDGLCWKCREKQAGTYIGEE
jgi:hypothetical protein